MGVEAQTTKGDEPIRFWDRGEVAFLELRRPGRANAYDHALLDRFEQTLDRLTPDSPWRVMVVTGSGEKSFCAGADLHELAGRRADDALDLRSARLFDRLAELPLVTVAAINGVAVGGGLELALACDLRLAASQARFWFPETALGLIPAAGGTQRLTRAVGDTRSKELILGGREWTAEEAHRHGLVNEVVAGPQLLEAAEAWAGRIARRDRLALRLAKTAIGLDAGLRAGRAFEAAAQAALYERRSARKDGDGMGTPTQQEAAR